MVYLYLIPIIAISVIIYIVTKKWDLKIFNSISEVVIIVATIFFIVTYASFLGYNIPFISSFCNNLINYIKHIL